MMIFFRFLAVVLVLGFVGYAVWDLKLEQIASTPVPRDELATQNEEISRIMARHQSALAAGADDSALAGLDSSLDVIETEYGPQSPEHIQALSEAAIMVARAGKPDIGETYMVEAAAGARHTYTSKHRETALILHDLANLKIANAGDETDLEAITILREVVTTRRDIIGPDHGETRGAEISLADALFTQWIGTEEEGADSPLLSEAEGLIARPIAVSETDSDYAHLQARGARLLYGRVLFAQERYQEALNVYDETLTTPAETPNPQVYMVLATVYSEQIMALRELGREDEAEELRLAINTQIQEAATAQSTETN